MGADFHFLILLALGAVIHCRQVEVLREEDDYHIGRGLSDFASDSPSGCKGDRCRSSQHLSDRDTDYPSSHLRDQPDLDSDQAYVHEERDIDAFLEDRGPTHLRQHDSLFQSDEPVSRREDTSYRSGTDRDPTVTYYAEPPRHVYDDQSTRRNQSDDTTSWNPFRRGHSHEERHYRLQDSSRSASHARSSPSFSRDSRYPYEEEEQRSRLGLYPESSSRRYDTRDSETFVDKYFRKSRCPQLRELARQSARTQARGLFDSQRVGSSDELYSPSSCRGLFMEDPNRIVVIHLDSSDNRKSMKKHLKGKSSRFQRRSDDIDVDGVDFLQLLDMMDEEEERLTRPSSRLSLTSRLPRRSQLEDEELDTLAHSLRSRAADRRRSSALMRSCKSFRDELEADEDEEPSCSGSSKSKSRRSGAQDEEETESEKKGKKTTSKGISKNRFKGNSKGGKSKKQKK
ncbi:hypothetical protein RvY_05556 [Ramazzottius varieornatus]|uniref:Uncharacterized protein n=1 Tax=Ramazzottius varieornatus TaxID=947166 RepID=A0A1D1UW02_RAMVA|nr:hypothetical protein RvY_05556 [Ramazzottius varieornatus]